MTLLNTINGIDLLALLLGFTIGAAAVAYHARTCWTARYWYRLGRRHEREDRQQTARHARSIRRD